MRGRRRPRARRLLRSALQAKCDQLYPSVSGGRLTSALPRSLSVACWCARARTWACSAGRLKPSQKACSEQDPSASSTDEAKRCVSCSFAIRRPLKRRFKETRNSCRTKDAGQTGHKRQDKKLRFCGEFFWIPREPLTLFLIRKKKRAKLLPLCYGSLQQQHAQHM